MKTPRPNLAALVQATGVAGASAPTGADAPPRLLVKVCGMRDADALTKVAALKPDFLGFIFAPASPRFVGAALVPEQLQALPPAIWKVGVFVNETTDHILQTAEHFGLAAVQLHGHETPAQCAALSEAGLLVMKAFSVGEAVDFAALLPYVPHCDYFLFDAKGAAPGGNGLVFNWKLLQGYNLPVPYFLAGGLGLEHAAELAALRLPGLAGVDLNSGFETAPGVKNATRLAQMLTQLRSGASFL
ncbi:phosphoribosylanthranilate isomerase [Hymenobacter properus]|uniref:N-(5'-phosphoribosyl)anthranilate isomerase n=1 Tax=Hymenobacter properus TaxID=2791026 RepID=A0A931BBV6_9BACT|nr:phosphoribosylanthranilate isomerase [Hymenobacter properus]MBF9140434.1 phosphoribosylanthranilate isomerase [Hymenobacter properus]MBR7719241.1 phosphoribosylanthranilate isomerase [Microvirga sp. SRT04]